MHYNPRACSPCEFFVLFSVSHTHTMTKSVNTSSKVGPKTGPKSSKVVPLVVRPKKKRRKPSQRKAISEIKKYQQGKFATSTLIPKSCFSRLARKTAEDYKYDLRFQDGALENLQSACEAYIVELLNNGNKIATSSGRMTLQANDLRLAHSIATGGEFHMLTEEEKKLEASLVNEEEEADEDDGDLSVEEDEDGEYTDEDDTEDESV